MTRPEACRSINCPHAILQRRRCSSALKRREDTVDYFIVQRAFEALYKSPRVMAFFILGTDSSNRFYFLPSILSSTPADSILGLVIKISCVKDSAQLIHLLCPGVVLLMYTVRTCHTSYYSTAHATGKAPSLHAVLKSNARRV